MSINYLDYGALACVGAPKTTLSIIDRNILILNPENNDVREKTGFSKTILAVS